jgi:hypothetical protein
MFLDGTIDSESEEGIRDEVKERELTRDERMFDHLSIPNLPALRTRICAKSRGFYPNIANA